MAGLRNLTGAARYQARKAGEINRVERSLRKANAVMIGNGLPKSTASEFAKGARGTAEKMSSRGRREVLSRKAQTGMKSELKSSRSETKANNAMGAAKKGVSRRATAQKAVLRKKGKSK